ncbi:MAG: PIG-L family deacetylase [Pseudomonadota bacterium]|nr:PIG-L family deacetylase [Pseudomonadota bacterium]
MSDDHKKVKTVEQLVAEWRSLGRSVLHSSRPLSVVVIGAHPDDTETGCGGITAQLAAQGHEVRSLYLTRGEAGRLYGRPAGNHDAGSIRTRESQKACAILGTKPVFAGQIDQKTRLDAEHLHAFKTILFAGKPDIVLTHWSLDSHADHVRTAALTENAWRSCHHQFVLAHYEVMTQIQTRQFTPTCYVDIKSSCEQKKAAIFAHASQLPASFYPYHENLEKQRGRESGCGRAEALIVRRPYGLVAHKKQRWGGCGSRPIEAIR